MGWPDILLLLPFLGWELAAGHRPSAWFWPGAASLGVVLGVAGRKWWCRRGQTGAEPGSPRSRRSPPPSFVWQAGLILLPVVGLAALGFLATYRDYALTEQEARQRAAGLAAEWAVRLAGALADEFIEWEAWGQIWDGAGVAGGEVSWPGTATLSPAEQARYQARLDGWLRPLAPRHPEDLLPVRIELGPEGNLVWPRPVHLPEPADWWRNLSVEQAKHWQALEPAHTSEPGPAEAPGQEPPPGTSRDARLEAFLATDPGESARANAEFIRLLGTLPELPPAERVEPLLRFAQEHAEVQAESGLPLPALALGRALHESVSFGLSRPLFDELARQTRDLPSLLTPRLLGSASTLAALQDVEVQQAVEALQARWRGQERLRDLARRALTVPPTTSVQPTSLWLDARGERWFTLVGSGVPSPAPSDPDAARAGPGGPTSVRFFAKSIIRQALDRAMAAGRLSLPPYLALEAELDQESLTEPVPANASERRTVFASVVTTLAATAGSPPTPRGPDDATAASAPWPRPPRLALALVLSDPALLYAQARQRALTFGSVVLLGLATALVGLFAARRAFRHQLHLNELKSNFVSSVSHELRAPIASIRLLTESLARGTVTEEPHRREYYRLIGQECRRLSALIGNVLDFARIDRGRKHYEFEPTDLPALVTHTVCLFEPAAAERQVTLRLLPPVSLCPPPSLDGQAIQQALVNLIDNALKHAPPGTSVEVSLTSPERSPPPGATARRATGWIRPAVPASRPVLLLTVADAGPGIPPAEQARIFEPFYRRGSELRRETPGIGIGLSIVKHIAQAHQGRVWVESSPGRGSRFVLELPAGQPPQSDL
jgi:signal transduction histidine kinase